MARIRHKSKYFFRNRLGLPLKKIAYGMGYCVALKIIVAVHTNGGRGQAGPNPPSAKRRFRLVGPNAFRSETIDSPFGAGAGRIAPYTVHTARSAPTWPAGGCPPCLWTGVARHDDGERPGTGRKRRRAANLAQVLRKSADFYALARSSQSCDASNLPIVTVSVR